MSAGQRVTVRRSNRYSVVHDSILESKNLSFAGRVVLAWALGRPDGFDCWIWYMLEVLGLSEKEWKKAREQLIGTGFFKQTKTKGARGVFVWTNEFLESPELNVLATDKDKKPAKAAKPATPIPIPIPGKNAEEGMDFEDMKIDKTNKADVENAKKIACWPRASINNAVRSAKDAAPNGVAYPTAVLRFLMASGVPPSPPPPVQLAEWSIQAALQAKLLPAGMKSPLK